MNLRVGEIEAGIKEVLARQIKDKKWPWIREIKTYAGEFDEGISAVIPVFPAIWVAFKGSGSPKKTSHNKTVYPVEFVVLVGARSLRNEEARRTGAGKDIGTYEMLSNVQELLTGNSLSSVGISGLEPLELGRTKTIFNTKTSSQSASILSQDFTTEYTITASDRDREEAEGTNYIERINTDYYFDPKDFGIADASDLYELPKD